MEKARGQEIWYNLFDKLETEYDYDLDKWGFCNYEGTLGELADEVGIEVKPEERELVVATYARYDSHPKGNPNVWLELNIGEWDKELWLEFNDRTDW